MKTLLSGLLVALALLGVTELLLRVTGFRFIPPRSDFSASVDQVLIKKGPYWETNPVFGPVFQQQRLALEDPAQEFRIGLLGESSVKNLNDLRLTRTLLHTKTRRFLPVLNFGGVSYGTVRLVMHLPELLSHRPNVLFLYIGHNEFEENLLNELRISTSRFHLLDAWLVSSLRLYQAVSFGLHGAGGWLLNRNALVPVVDPMRRMSWDIKHDKLRVLALFRENLEKMVLMTKGAGMPLIMSTVAYNRRLPPFAPGENNPYKEGERAYREGRYEDAARLMEQGLDQDDNPHRASETTNRIVREVAGKFSVPLIEGDAEIKKIAEHGIPGPDLFIDHCHLNPEPGNALLERLLAAKILELGLLPR